MAIKKRIRKAPKAVEKERQKENQIKKTDQSSRQLSPIRIRQVKDNPIAFKTEDIQQLQPVVGNMNITKMLSTETDQKKLIQGEQIGIDDLSGVIQRTLYSEVEKKAKAGKDEKITKEEIEAATKEFIIEWVKDQGYLTGGEKPVLVSPELIKEIYFDWNDDYGAAEGYVSLPSLSKVINDIKKGVFKMALGHEFGHYIRSKEGQPNYFEDVEKILAEIDWDSEINKYPGTNGTEERWQEEARADLKSITFEYVKKKRYPTESELKAYQTILGPVVDAYHPPAALRVQIMRNYIKEKKSKGCYLTTACVEVNKLPDDCEKLTLLRHFRDTYLLNKPHGEALIELYYTYAPGIVEKINQDPQKAVIYEYIFMVLSDCVEAIKRQDMEYAFLKYCEMVVKLKEKFISEERNPDFAPLRKQALLTEIIL